MQRAGHALKAALLLTGSALLFPAAPAPAFELDVATALAARLLGHPSAPERWDPSWIETAVETLAAAGSLEEVDPESLAILHRYDALRPRAQLHLREPEDEVTGLAPFVFAAAAESLELSLRAADREGTVRALATLARGACDLADPFLTTPPHSGEFEGARAWFSDLIAAPALSALEPVGYWRGEALALGIALARTSASLRPAVEAASRRGDSATLARIRKETLGRAWGVAQSVVRRACERAWALPPIEPPDFVLVVPHPARDHAAIHFDMESAGAARLEVFDVQGRRILDLDLGDLPAGATSAGLGAAQLRGVRPGAYVVRVLTPTRILTTRLVRAR